jgi:FkbM family methyltransferase
VIPGFRLQFCAIKPVKYLFIEHFINQEYLFTSKRKSPLIIDCGSNIGVSILFFKFIYPTSRIIAFEPDPITYGCLEHNIHNNQLLNVESHRKALAGYDGCINFYTHPGEAGSLRMSVIQERMPYQAQTVECTRLSNFISEEVDFLKIDVEGAEQEILMDLESSRKLCLIQQMVIEYHHHINKSVDELSRIFRLLEQSGFGYQVECQLERPLKSRSFQDILIYAYRKDETI